MPANGSEVKRILLILSAPIWLLPYLLVALARLCQEGLVFEWGSEDGTGWAAWLESPLALPLCLLLYPAFGYELHL